jgi:hypothetical protein
MHGGMDVSLARLQYTGFVDTTAKNRRPSPDELPKTNQLHHNFF